MASSSSAAATATVKAAASRLLSGRIAKAAAAPVASGTCAESEGAATTVWKHFVVLVRIVSWNRRCCNTCKLPCVCGTEQVHGNHGHSSDFAAVQRALRRRLGADATFLRSSANTPSTHVGILAGGRALAKEIIHKVIVPNARARDVPPGSSFTDEPHSPLYTPSTPPHYHTTTTTTRFTSCQTEMLPQELQFGTSSAWSATRSVDSSGEHAWPSWQPTSAATHCQLLARWHGKAT